jgi:hypothetical protein
MVWTVAPPNQQKPQGQGNEYESYVLLPRATATTPPSEPRAGSGAKREPHQRGRVKGVEREGEH